MTETQMDRGGGVVCTTLLEQTLSRICCTLYTIHCTLCSVHCTPLLHYILCTVYSSPPLYLLLPTFDTNVALDWNFFKKYLYTTLA